MFPPGEDTDYDNFDIHVYPEEKRFRTTKIRNRVHLDLLHKELANLELARQLSEVSFDRERERMQKKLGDLKTRQQCHSECGSPRSERKSMSFSRMKQSLSTPNLSSFRESSRTPSLPIVVITPCEGADRELAAVNFSLQEDETDNGLGDVSRSCSHADNYTCARYRANSLDRKIEFDRFPSLGRFGQKTVARKSQTTRPKISLEVSPAKESSSTTTAGSSRVATPWAGVRRSPVLTRPNLNLLQIPKQRLETPDENGYPIEKAKSMDDIRKLVSPESSPLLPRRVQLLKGSRKSSSVPNSPRLPHRLKKRSLP